MTKIQNKAGVKPWLGIVCLASLRTKVQSPEAIFKKQKPDMVESICNPGTEKVESSRSLESAIKLTQPT